MKHASNKYWVQLVFGLTLTATATLAFSQVKIGVTVSETGPAASLGIVEKRTLQLLPDTLGGEKVEYIILDDASDTTAAVRNARRLTSEDKVDALIGSTTTPNSLAMLDVAAEFGTPMIAMGAGAAIVEPMDARRRWAFKAVHNDGMMVDAIVEHMVKKGVKTVGYIGFADATGEGYWTRLKSQADANGLKIVANERYGRGDNSVTAQALKIASANPDAVLIAASGSPAALPQISLKERGYKGVIYQTHGVANNDFLRVAGASAEGTYLPVGPLLVADQLPADSAVGKIGRDVIKRYEQKHGEGSRTTFISNAYDPYLLLDSAVRIAVKKAKPGTPEFRSALRDALESTKEFAGSQGYYNMTASDHVGLDKRSRYIVRIESGKWKLAP
ncbi:ABC transporter substrate-binding protein [Ottowia thiooxydans]|uniref:ABC transporter substrate-binding protein n=1 Tax=Ottowia thiooxydans TaxID=219182 RepID=UPI0004284011|nr:ABC transporter substrate-binding protein [Ottowia thiooxydans]